MELYLRSLSVLMYKIKSVIEFFLLILDITWDYGYLINKSMHVVIQISVEWKSRSGLSQVHQPRTMHFKISDKNVILFPPGMSAAVLWAICSMC